MVMSAEAGWFPNRFLGWVRRHPLLSVVALVLVLGLLANLSEEEETTSAGDASSQTAPSSDRQDDPRKREKRTRSEKDGKDRSKKPGDRTEAKPPSRTYLVTRVVDGDTIELGNGETVRLVGIDTPEVGECGFERSSEVLGELVLNQQVRLSVSDEDRDQYDRLLRYVDVGTMDAGLRLIKRGLAIARYDSRDGYGYHPREPVYVAADRRSPNISCPKPQPLVQAPSGAGSCAPGYNPCVPPYPPDLDCADVNGPIYVNGPDPHGLDADGDGVACES
jgi:endonuclease YncB( thermonuclease family)